MPHEKKKSSKKSSSTSKSIVPDGNIGGKKVTTPRTRRPAPKKSKS